jgi:cell pole-organizing protein PopZ
VQDDIDAMFAAAAAEPEPKPEPEPAPEEPAEILELTEAMEAPAEPEPTPLRRIDGSSDVVYNEAPEPPPTIAAARRNFEEHTGADRSLLAPSTTAAVDSAFNTLAQTVLVQNSRTLDDLVREMLRPMLKAWLDDNLPVMVERLVRAEIERVSRGRG